MTPNTNSNMPHQMPDVFDMERLAQPQPTSMGTDRADDAGQQPQAPLSKIVHATKPLHIAVVGAAAAMLWIAWPYVFPDESSSMQPASRLMLPTIADSSQPVDMPAPMRGTPATSQLPPQQANETPATSQPSMPPFTAPVSQAPPIQASRSRRLLRRSGNAAYPASTTNPVAGPASSQFSINTVYTGQAWIQDDERTYVVQPGDQIKGVLIVSIDARQRIVVTSQGVIR